MARSRSTWIIKPRLISTWNKPSGNLRIAEFRWSRPILTCGKESSARKPIWLPPSASSSARPIANRPQVCQPAPHALSSGEFPDAKRVFAQDQLAVLRGVEIERLVDELEFLI